jgi:D-aspartate ligase
MRRKRGMESAAAWDVSVPAVVLNLFNHCGLAVVRTLGRLGVPVYGIHEDRRVPALRSRYCRSSFLWDIARAPAHESVQRLIEIGQQIGDRPVLIPTEDVGCLFVDDHADELEQAFRFPRRREGLAGLLSDKEEMYYLCQVNGVQTPATYAPRSRREAKEFAYDASFPVMVKGVDNRQFDDLPGAGKVAVNSCRELLAAYEMLTGGQKRPILLQEYIPGDATSAWMFNGYFNANSECLFGLTGQKLRQYPPYIGQTSLGRCVENTTVQRLTRLLMDQVEYTGVLDIEFRYDARDGQYKLLDVNPRVGAAFRLFLGQNGLDVVRALYLDLTGQAVPQTSARSERKWLVENYDLIASLKYHRDGVLGPRDWLRSFCGVEEAGWFALDDPRPFAAMWVRSARYKVDRFLVSGRPERAWWEAA